MFPTHVFTVKGDRDGSGGRDGVRKSLDIAADTGGGWGSGKVGGLAGGLERVSRLGLSGSRPTSQDAMGGSYAGSDIGEGGAASEHRP